MYVCVCVLFCYVNVELIFYLCWLLFPVFYLSFFFLFFSLLFCFSWLPFLSSGVEYISSCIGIFDVAPEKQTQDSDSHNICMCRDCGNHAIHHKVCSTTSLVIAS
jgi:hypothetical protein